MPEDGVHPAPEPSTADTIRVLLICRVRLYSDAIIGLLNRHPSIMAVGLAEVGGNVLAELKAAAADVVLLDVGTPGALALADSIVRLRPGTRILALGVDEAPIHIVACAKAGLWGYVPCDASIEDVAQAVQRIASGRMVCSEQMAEKLYSHIRGAARDDLVPATHAVLTYRQRQILQLIDRGLSNKQIARELSLGTSTVKNHVHSILGRLKVGRRGEAAARFPSTSGQPLDARR
jgi:two-component system, NarL family, nitrate/nitrite response regulator NarL